MDCRCSMKMGGGPHDVVVVVIEWTTEFGSQAANPSFPLERGKKKALILSRKLLKAILVFAIVFFGLSLLLLPCI